MRKRGRCRQCREVQQVQRQAGVREEEENPEKEACSGRQQHKRGRSKRQRVNG